MSYNYRRDSRGLQALLTSTAMQDAVVEVAEDAAAFARSIAPRRTGKYADSFEVERAEFPGPGSPRKGAVVANTSEHAAAVEWGQNRHILGQTLARFNDGE